MKIVVKMKNGSDYSFDNIVYFKFSKRRKQTKIKFENSGKFFVPMSNNIESLNIIVNEGEK